MQQRGHKRGKFWGLRRAFGGLKTLFLRDRGAKGSTDVFTYKPAGNRLSSQGQAPGSGRSTEYVYDFENRLTEVNYTGMLAQYKYDPFGRRIEKNVSGTITRYLYDGPNIVTEYDGTWNVTAKYIHTPGVDDPLTVEQGANIYYYHKDGLGSVLSLTDSAGNLAKRYTYKSFGEIYSETGSLVQPFTFTGREYDAESGLYFYRARYYDPRAGRFLTRDPIGFGGGDVNLYRAVTNNPINFVDPSGLSNVIFDPSRGALIIIPERAPLYGPSEFPAANNVTRPNANPYQPEGNGPVPYGSFPMGPYRSRGNDPNSSFGIGSIPIILPLQIPFREPRTGVLLHSGRATRCDRAGRCGVNAVTLGCIRTTDDAMRILRFDPPKTITIIDEPLF